MKPYTKKGIDMLNKYSAYESNNFREKENYVYNKWHIHSLEKIAEIHKAPQLSSTIYKMNSLYVLMLHFRTVCLTDIVANS